jgi:Protein of unknown function (DUF2505)
VEFSTTNRIEASVDEVLAAMADPAYYEHLATKVTAIERPELLSDETTDGVLELKVRYAFAGEIGGAARMFIDRDKLTWVIHSTWQLDQGTAVVEIVPDHYADLVVADAAMHLRPAPGGCTQSMEGTLDVKVPLVGAQAERIIVDGLLKHLEAEAAALSDFAAERR